MRVLVVNGPNLNLLGSRQPEVYGSTTSDELRNLVEQWGQSMGVEVVFEQSNSEVRIIDLIQRFEGDGIIINPGALSHTSRAIADAISSVGTPVVEVHLSNVKQREDWRRISVVSDACLRTIYGRGPIGYRHALRHLVNALSSPFETVAYGPHPDNVGDLRVGEGDLYVLAHGGVWRREFERDTIESLAVDLSNRGSTTWNIEYRRLGDGGGWPGSGHDVLTALDFVPQLGIEYSRLIVVGHSAGAYLLMWAAQRSTSEVALHVALAPLLDLEGSAAAADITSVEAKLLLESGAPRARPGVVPTILVHGREDQIVPFGRTEAFAADQALELLSSDTDHFSLLDPAKPEWTRVLERVGEAR